MPTTTLEHKVLDPGNFAANIAELQRWYSFKHGREISSRRWVKCHFITGVKTNIIPSVKITSEFDNDSPQLKELVQQTAENFDMEEISGDKAYLSRDNLNLIAEVGAIPYIPFKSNATNKARGSMVWKKMFYLFQLNNERFLERYNPKHDEEW